MLGTVGRRAASTLSGAAKAGAPGPCAHARSLWGEAVRPAAGPKVGGRYVPVAGNRRIAESSSRRGQGGAKRQHTRADGGQGHGYRWQGNVPLSWSMAAASAVAGATGIVMCKAAVELPKGIITIDDIKEFFEVGDMIGEGGFAAVYKAIYNKSKKEIALKIMSKSNPETPLVMRDEVEVMRAVGEHENLVCLHDTYETPRSYVLVLDLADGGALFDRVVDEGKLSEKEASGYILQVLDAILHMHRRKVVHGDIKPENLLLTSDDPNASIKICDFGMARFMDAKESMVLNQNTGTMDYWSPEIVKNGQCGHGIDMWALGVVTYIMLCGCNPFDPRGSATDAEILTNITNGAMDESNPVWKVLTNDCKDLIKGLLTVDASKRLTAGEAMQHPWLVGGKASDKGLPGVHHERLVGYQALTQMRNTMAALRLDTAALFKVFSKDGEIDKAQLKQAFRSIGTDLSDEAVNGVMQLADVSGDGKIDQEEFEGMMKMSRSTGGADNMPDDQIKALFKIFDENGDGRISATEMTHVLGMLGRKMSIRRASSIVNGNIGGWGAKKADDAEAGLSYEDFKKVMRRRLFEEDKD